MKKVILSVLVSSSLFSCSKNPVQIGHINMISNRNISQSTDYEVLQKFSNSSSKQLKRTKSKTLNDAIDNVVKAVPGGEYLMNAKLYRVGSRFAAEGDVWGIANQTDINGFKPNGIAYLKRRGGSDKVKILSFVDKDKINVQLENGKIIVVDRSKLVSGSAD